MLVSAIMSGLCAKGNYRKGLETSKREQYIQHIQFLELFASCMNLISTIFLGGVQ